MTEQAGHMNQPDLIHECAIAIDRAAMGFLKGCWSNGMHNMGAADIPDELFAKATIDVLRKRGLLNLQGLELIKQSGESK